MECSNAQLNTTPPVSSSSFIPPAYEMYEVVPDAGPRYVLIKPGFFSYKFKEVDKTTFLSNYHSQFSGDYEWFGMVDDGIYQYLGKLNSLRSRFVPFCRWFRVQLAKKYMLRRKQDLEVSGQKLSVGLDEAVFLARATNGREGTVLVMWKRRFLFTPKPSGDGAVDKKPNY